VVLVSFHIFVEVLLDAFPRKNRACAREREKEREEGKERKRDRKPAVTVYLSGSK